MGSEYKSASLLVRIISACLVLYALTSIVLGLIGLKTIASFKPGPLDIPAFAEGVSSSMPTGTLDFFLFIALIVLFCVWIHRVNSNARALGAHGMRFSPGWAVGWFFIPIMNLFRPYQIVRELWKASDPERVNDWEQIPTPIWLKAWWALCLLSVIGIHLTNPSVTSALIIFLLAFGTVKITAQVGSCLLALRLLRSVNARQEAKSGHAGADTHV
jgi:hypothetical protein